MKTIEDVIRHTFNASHEGKIHFGQVVAQLIEVGIESYFVDFRACRATYYLPSGETVTLSYEPTEDAIGETFSQAGVKAAILGAQRGEVMYPEFKQLSQKAGCVGYIVWLTGRHVTYFGRNGETHIEHFPN